MKSFIWLCFVSVDIPPEEEESALWLLLKTSDTQRASGASSCTFLSNISHKLFLFPDLLLRVPFASIQSLCLTVWLWPHLCPLFLIFSVCHSIWFIDCCWGALVQTPKEGMSGTGADSDALKLNYYSCHCLRLPLTAVCVIKPQKKYFLSTYWHIPLYRPTHLSVGNIGIEEKNSSPKSIFKSLQTYIFVLRH